MPSNGPGAYTFCYIQISYRHAMAAMELHLPAHDNILYTDISTVTLGVDFSANFPLFPRSKVRSFARVRFSASSECIAVDRDSTIAVGNRKTAEKTFDVRSIRRVRVVGRNNNHLAKMQSKMRSSMLFRKTHSQVHSQPANIGYNFHIHHIRSLHSCYRPSYTISIFG